MTSQVVLESSWLPLEIKTCNTVRIMECHSNECWGPGVIQCYLNCYCLSIQFIMDITTVCCLLCFFFCLYDLVLCIHDWRKVVWIYMVSVGIAMWITIYHSQLQNFIYLVLWIPTLEKEVERKYLYTITLKAQKVYVPGHLGPGTLGNVLGGDIPRCPGTFQEIWDLGLWAMS